MPLRSFLVVATLTLAASGAYASDYKVGSIDVSGPWARATPKGAAVGGGYMKITNEGTAPDRLIGGSSDVSKTLEVHEMTEANGVMKMRPVKGGLEIKPGQTVELHPGSYHVMFTGLKKPLKPGDHVKTTLNFEKAGKVTVDFDVMPLGATTGSTTGSASGGMTGMKMHGH